MTERRVDASSVRAVRVGHGGNCSSVGSVIDTLFLGAAAGGAMLAAICAAMHDEPVRVVGPPGPTHPRQDADDATGCAEEEGDAP